MTEYPTAMTGRVLTPRRYVLMQNVGAYTRDSIAAQEVMDHAWDMLCMRLTASILTDTQVSETQEVELAVPATWWQHLKRDNWLARKVWRRRRVRMHIMKQRVTFERIRGYPQADVVVPREKFGIPVIYDKVTEGGWWRAES